MSSNPSTTRKPQTPSALYAAFVDWARTDGRTWIYLFKVLVACFLALGIAMKLELPQPRTAMTTVFIVMQPQSGMVFAKSFYRVCGTLIGLVVMMVLIALFAQQRELFIISTAIWIGICTAGAARNRNFRSYGFVLAGYTAALIGIPASQQPDGAFMSALTRVAEIVVGILCSGVVSALVFPQHAGERMRSTVRARFSSFVDYLRAALSGNLDHARIEATNARFVADIVGFEAVRSVAVFESPDSRMRNGRLSRLNSEFMMVSTRFHALQQLMNRLRASGVAGATAAVETLEPHFREIAPLMSKSGEPVLTAADAAHAAAQLEAFKAELPKRVRASRTTLERDADMPLLDFDTGAELLHRFVDDLHAYASTYASLAVATHERERWIARYEPKTNGIAAGVAGLRAAIVLAIVGTFWIATAWPSGTMFTLNAATTCALAASSPNPTRTAFQMAAGSILSSVLALILTFGIFPHIDGFPLLCAALTPFLAFGAWMTTRPKLAGYGGGYCIFFCLLAGPDNVMQYDPSSFINNAIALALSMLVTSIAFAVLLPPSTSWLRNRQLADLRAQVVLACRGRIGRLWRLRTRFESGARDLMHQINALATNEPVVKHNTMRWMFAVLEIGNAVIDLRSEVATLPRDARYAPSMPWRVSLLATCTTVSRLFERPRPERLEQALAATADSIAAVRQMLATFTPPRDERHQLQRILSHLHFIRSALLDPQSPLGQPGDADDVSGAASQGVHHAT
jgi:uncharacterized membrane protein YccC